MSTQPKPVDAHGSEEPLGPEAGGSAGYGADANELQPGDWYMEGEFLVFTAQYHLRRGYCCNSGCRHCPYQH